MNITFFIGNGFDINMGLATQYSDFYPYFLKNANANNMIRGWIDGNEKLWSDLEEKLGQETQKIQVGEIEQFYDDKEELDRLLIDYLEEEQKKCEFNEPEKLKKEFSKSMLHFYDELSEKDVASIKKTMEIYKNEEYLYSYITFNYTNILESLLGLYSEQETILARHNGNTKNDRIGQVIHIHGTTDEEMILGVNDVNQINNDLLKGDDMFLDTFIKSQMNNNIGQRKIEKTDETINKSHIICIFGMSIGNTDKMWWEVLINWLVSNENNKLIIFWKVLEDSLRRRLPSKVIRLNDNIRRKIFDKGKGKYDEACYEKIKNRIMISYNSKIFSFLEIKSESDKN